MQLVLYILVENVFPEILDVKFKLPKSTCMTILNKNLDDLFQRMKDMVPTEQPD